jgi:hypothetical protein
MAESGLDPIGEAASRPSMACGPRLDPIGEAASRPSMACGPRLDPIGDERSGLGYFFLGPRLSKFDRHAGNR